MQRSTAHHPHTLQEVDRSGAEEAAAPQVRMRHFTAALQRVPPSVSARDRQLYDAMRSQVTRVSIYVQLLIKVWRLTGANGTEATRQGQSAKGSVCCSAEGAGCC
jgi:Vps4 C terminal oligomerisation domain